MDCSVVREALSAELDGETSPVVKSVVDSHIESCARCQEWRTSAAALHRTVRVAPAEGIPDLTPAILVAMGNQRDAAKSDSLRACRWLLAACAVLQLATAVPSLIGNVGGPIHLDHELGSWDIGLAFGFLIAALQPNRAWGMLPLIFVVGSALGVTSVVDIFSGTVSVTRESTHVSELLGFVFTFLVARLNPAATKLKIALG